MGHLYHGYVKLPEGKRFFIFSCSVCETWSNLCSYRCMTLLQNGGCVHTHFPRKAPLKVIIYPTQPPNKTVILINYHWHRAIPKHFKTSYHTFHVSKAIINHPQNVSKPSPVHKAMVIININKPYYGILWVFSTIPAGPPSHQLQISSRSTSATSARRRSCATMGSAMASP